MTRKAWLVLAAVLCLSFPALAQNVTVTGTVYEPDGEPAIGASVTLKGQTTGVATDIDGNYRIAAPADGTLVFSYIGYETQEVAVGGRTAIDVTLKTNTAALNELVVVGYGMVKKSDATGSVAVVKPDEIEAGLATSAQDMLVGASPGVVVTTTGNPSGGADILIRGGSSLLAGNKPLIVIDGVPMSGENVKGGSNPLGLVNPENVESMTILKDASATAIYGSRASNGVIIITTKKGKSGKPQVNFTANMYVNTPRNTMNMMNGREFADYVINRYGADSNQAQALGVDGVIYDTDWQNQILGTRVSSDYSLSVGGTAGKVPYRVSLSYTDNNGIINTTSMDRATAGISINPKFFDDLLSVNANIKGAYIKNGYERGGTLGGAVSFNPTLPVYMPGGNNLLNYTSYGAGTELLKGDSGNALNTLQALNPVAQLFEYHKTSKVYQSIGNLQLDLRMPFLRELRANLNLAYDYSHGQEINYDAPFSPAAWSAGHYVPGSDVVVTDGYATKGTDTQEMYNLLLDFYLNYNKEFKAIKSSLDVTAGYSWQKFHNKGNGYGQVYAPGQSFDGYQRSETTYYSRPYQLVSFFGRLNYTFMDRYLITATVRQDGTSRFSKDSRWGTFPSVALGWKILEESFMEGARSFMNELKIRAGYGITGQQNLGDDYLFAYLPTYGVSTNMNQMYLGPDGKTYYTVMPSAFNSVLKWEETHTWNAGIDFGFLNNRIAGSIDFYKRKTKDLLTVATYPVGSNLSNMGAQNLGDLENIGIEFNLLTKPVVTKEFTWTSNFNIAWNKNKVTRLAEGADTTAGSIGTAGNIQKHQEGFPAFSFWVYEQVYNADGTPVEGVYVDRNGDGSITADDRYLYHSKDPAVTLNWQNTFNWKNWDFGFTLRSSIGNWVYNKNECDNAFASRTSVPPLSNMLKGVYVWEQTKTEAMQLSDYWVRNASFVRCDNITLGYTWSDLLNNALRIRLYGAVQNPFVITKYNGMDPEVFEGIDNNVYPRPTTYSLGLVATF